MRSDLADEGYFVGGELVPAVYILRARPIAADEDPAAADMADSISVNAVSLRSQVEPHRGSRSVEGLPVVLNPEAASAVPGKAVGMAEDESLDAYAANGLVHGPVVVDATFDPNELGHDRSDGSHGEATTYRRVTSRNIARHAWPVTDSGRSCYNVRGRRG